jgi:hypothetical protein
VQTGKMASSWILRRVALVRTDVSKERSASIIRVTRIGELGTTLLKFEERCLLGCFHGGIDNRLLWNMSYTV